MQWYWWLLIAYVVFINVFAVIITIVDKKRAKKSQWRIRERTLFLVSALGGSVAMLITMKKIRHKTQHKSFMIGIPLIIAAQILLIGFILYLVLK